MFRLQVFIYFLIVKYFDEVSYRVSLVFCHRDKNRNTSYFHKCIKVYFFEKKNFSDKRVFRRFEFSDKYQNCVLSET